MFENKDVKILLSQAGSGKTHFLLNEIKKELKNSLPSEIAFVSFTRKGAQEGLWRACREFDLDADDLPYFGTIHSLVYRYLRETSAKPFLVQNQRQFNKKYGYHLTLFEEKKMGRPMTRDSKYIQFYQSQRLHTVSSGDEINAEIEIGYYNRLVSDYEKFKAEEDLEDFSDILLNYKTSAKTLPCKTLFVDECFAKGTRVRMADGTVKEIQDIKEGMFVAGTRGAVRVTHTTSGVDSLYNVIAKKNKTLFTCNSKHLVLDSGANDWAPAQTIGNNGMVNFKAFEGQERELNVDPYFFGYWIGNGTTRNVIVSVDLAEKDVIAYLENYAKAHGDVSIIRKQKNTYQMSFNHSEGAWKKSHIREQFESYGLLLDRSLKSNPTQCVPQKRIPDDYFTASKKQRLELLAGILDSDGALVCHGIKNKYRVEMANKHLMEDVYNLAGSLGFNPTVYHTHHNTKAGVKHYYRVDFFGTEDIPCKIKRKKQTVIDIEKELPVRVEYAGKGEYYGITVDSPDSLFLLENGCVVHNCQDLSLLQWHILDKAFQSATRVIASGDENQSLYEFNGARADVFIDMAEKFPKDYLPVSYRIPQSVFHLSKAIVDNIVKKTDKPFEMKADSLKGSVSRVFNTESVIKKIEVDASLKEQNKTSWYLLARNVSTLSRYTELLELNLIPYWTPDGFFLDERTMTKIKDYMYYRKIGYKTDEQKIAFMEKYGVTDFAKPISHCDVLPVELRETVECYLEQYGIDKLLEWSKRRVPPILVSTIHGVKGGEADNVALCLDLTRRSRLALLNDTDNELRVLYVAVTRTKCNLYLIDSLGEEGYDRFLDLFIEQYGLDI